MENISLDTFESNLSFEARADENVSEMTISASVNDTIRENRKLQIIDGVEIGMQLLPNPPQVGS